MRRFTGNSLTSKKVIIGSTIALTLACAGLWLADPDAFPIKGPVIEAQQPGLTPVPSPQSRPPLSEAERIARLQRSIETDRKYLDSLNTQLKDPNSEYNRAEKHFQKLDAELEATRQDIQALKSAGKATEAADREAAFKDLLTRWQQGRDRFNLAIKEHKTLQESIAALTRKIQEDQQALDRLSGAATATTNPASTSHAEAKQIAPAIPEGTASPKSPSTIAAPSLLSLPESPLTVASASSSSSPLSQTAAPATPAVENVSRELVRAREEAKAKEEEAKKAESKAQSITERIDALRANITLTKKLLETARQRADQEQKTKNILDAELQNKMAAKAPEAELKNVSRHIEFAQRRFQDALNEVRSTTDHLHELQSELDTLQAEQITALREADAKKQAADAAEEKIAKLQNPFRLHNILEWLIHHGPRLFTITLGMLILHRLSRVLSRRVVKLMAQSNMSKRGSHQDRENRAQTLVGVFSSAVSLLVLGGGTLMILDQVGIPIVPLMGGAAVLGLAVAFGAQNLIKDYFSGFMVLLEDQYGINDVVRIGSISGLVEHISLRTTVLRDLEGIVHFIPHGTITTVSNLTHGWSRALFDVGIAYKEDVDRVMRILLDMGCELRRDPTFGPLILEDPEMLGVDELADSSVVLKFFIKTCPLQQWTVKREMLRRIKNKFDELGIEIPYPHQTVYHRYETPPPSGAQQTPYAPPPIKRVG